MTLLGALLAIVVGVTLGLFGGGGAVLTVPIFVYALDVPDKSAIPMSFVVIGTASAIGAVDRWRTKQLDPRRGIWIGIATVLGAFGGARVGAVLNDRVQLTLFGTAVVIAAFSLLRSAAQPDGARTRPPPAVTAAVFALIGGFTGMVGVGGGFLFVPALVTLGGVPMLEATGLSLMVIAMNASAALAGYVGRIAIDWNLSLAFAGVVVLAMLPAGAIAPKVPVAALKRAFAVVLIVVGTLVVFENLR